MIKILAIAGARPNFMKIAPLLQEIKKNPQIQIKLVHTGQHYDIKMSDVFFKELEISEPDIHLNVSSGSHAKQTADIMTAFEPVLLQEKPDWIIVVGDVTSTVACSLVAVKLGVRVAHVEAGLRSFDRTMPEEINRLVTDSISDLLFVSEDSGLRNLKREGAEPSKVVFVGNIMIDTLRLRMRQIQETNILKKFEVKPKHYAVATFHRQSNVDKKEDLQEIYHILRALSEKLTMVYPVHPRSRKMIQEYGLMPDFNALSNLIMTDPLGYVDFNRLVKDSKFVITDSGGIQEETTVMKIPCITVRENTERPSTVTEGTNVLVGRNLKKIMQYVQKILSGKWKKGRIPKYWDGHTARRIGQVFKKMVKERGYAQRV